jgi:metal-responsive CopG/Arc/MetJ family transcriptional regulator
VQRVHNPYIYRYHVGMDDVRVVRLPRDLVERVDEAAAGEMRSRSNLVRVLVAEGLQRRAGELAEPKAAS